MKILVVSMWPSSVAPERGVFVERQVEALRKLGHDVRVVPLTDLRAGRVRTPVKYLSLLARGVAAALMFRPAVVHGHYLLPTGAVARVIARAARVPYVVTAHGTDVANAEQSPALRRRTATVIAGASAVIAVSEPLADRLRALFPGAALEVLDMGVDTAIFTPGPPGAGPSPADADPGRVRTSSQIVAVASLTPNKNHERLFRALAEIPDARLTVIGAGPCEQPLKQLADELQIAERIDFLGRLPHRELAAHYQSAACACLVSLQEGFGLSALEALACGCPVVVSRAIPIADLVRPDTSGALVDPLDPHSIAAGIRRCLAIENVPPAAIATALRGRSNAERAAQTAEILNRVV